MERDAATKLTPRTIMRVLGLASPYRWQLGQFLLIVVADAAIAVANPLIYRDLINEGILSHRADVVIRLAALAGALSLAAAALGLWQTYLSARIGASLLLLLRRQLFEHVQTMPLGFFATTQTGALLSRLNNDVAGAHSAFTDVLSNVIGNVIGAALVLGAMFALSWQVALASLALMPLIVWPNTLFGRKLKAITKESYDLVGDMHNVMVDRFNVSGAQIAKIFGRREREAELFAQRARRVSDIGVRRAIYGRVFFAALMFIWALATAIAYGWGGLLVIDGMLDLGALVALVAYLWRLCTSFMTLASVQVSIMTALVSFERVFEVLDMNSVVVERSDAVDIPAGPATITFDHVDFRYPAPDEISLASLRNPAPADDAPAGPVLRDVSFTVGPGRRLALVGPSGAGKTTVTQLVPRFYDPTGGAVRINGVDLKHARLDSIVRRVGMVTQEPFLFHATIRENLLYARPAASEAELIGALRAAQLLPLVQSLPLGLDTLVGDRGFRFSGGERQRLCIARMLLKAPDIVLLDEATAYLDSESEAALQAALEVALQGRTSIVVAHRLSTIVSADEIVVLDRGAVVERGTHATLAAKNGLYAELCRRQFAELLASPRSADPWQR